jgi:hypothetical protein
VPTSCRDASRRTNSDTIARRAEKIGDELTRKIAARTAGEKYSIMTNPPDRVMRVAQSPI